ncbi:MAG: DNA polymerase III subunit gamma/tau [Pseudonocardiales bacterium]|nr:MAG: DNA polymerase III subunit gamma/tau [Pseudonocardiales bacterium]
MALYRRYRPATFAEVVGQEHVTEPLQQALRNDRLHHAYLFSGPRGCGKTSSARILARSLNCEKGPTPDPCGVCDSCVALAPGGPGSLDVIEIDAASHNGVDDARDLRERAFFSPISSRFKVYVIDEAHMVTTAAFNALLKLVEEPPEFVTFIFATTEPDKVLPTIRSRTHHYPFRLLPPTVLRGLLEEICAKEGVTVDPAVLPLVVRAGGGSARDALSILDQLMAGAGPDGVPYLRALSLLGVTDAALLDDVVDALGAADGAAVFEAVDKVVEAGHDPRRFATDLLERLRDLVVTDAVPDAAAKGLIDAPEDQLLRMGAQASRLGTATLSRLADIVHDGLVEMRGTTSPRLLLELVCARMLLPAATGAPGALLQRVERLERRLDIGAGPVQEVAPAAPAVQERPAKKAPSAAAAKKAASAEAKPAPAAPAEPAAPPAATAEAPAGGTIDAAAVRRVWPDLVARVRDKKRTVAAYLLDATVTSVEGGRLVLSFPHSFHANALSQSPAVDYFRDALKDVLGVEWQVQCDVSGTPAAAQSTLTGFAPGDEAADEPPVDPDAAPPPSPEETAISLLEQSLGAKKISDA